MSRQYPKLISSCGQRFPDALSKTVPSWYGTAQIRQKDADLCYRCSVINRAVAARRKARSTEDNFDTAAEVWDTALYVPPQTVSQNEKVQIETRLDGWAAQLLVSLVSGGVCWMLILVRQKGSSLEIPDLCKPLRPFFIHPGQTMAPSIPKGAGFIPVFCLCASMFIDQGGPVSVRDQWGGFEYIQGSGDDDELWGKVSLALFNVGAFPNFLLAGLDLGAFPSIQRATSQLSERCTAGPDREIGVDREKGNDAISPSVGVTRLSDRGA